ncbi:hypothetical protein [Sphingomonas sanxanigenens]|uniref:Uncharacterized protein n=1 Tax=Sphingomonas sanxanigenens DSM 19645 = NX02 TaxID=1123269 RepID=W0A8K2_9SPHN|nr:hypothetical protein [Sphingomonas sanxanigenens]AHE52653.1 hypothetical protein NX02_04545 [Sphingomonas sanxanigenens DSM 19645 = NX02]
MIHWLPPTYIVDMRRPNAANNPVRIKIRRGAPYPGAILAQERWEWGFKIPLFLLGFVPVLLTRIGPIARHLELMGHAVEVAVATTFYGVADINAYEAREAAAMSSYPQFKGWDAGKIELELKKRRSKAMKWVGRHRKLIGKYVMAFAP